MTRKRKANYSEIELKRFLSFSIKEHDIWMPNEIFEDLVKRLREYQGIKTSTHYAYAYTFVFISNWLYRYAKHENNDGVEINEAVIKLIMGFAEKTDQYTYITKRKGILEQMGYIRKETDYPHSYCYETSGIRNIKNVVFTYYSELYDDEFNENRRNKKVNFPVKAFFRQTEAEEDGYCNGTFYEIENTHKLDIDIFCYCMGNKELGIEGFYLYSFLKYATDKHKNGFDCSFQRMSLLTGMSIDEVAYQLRNLEERNMITNDHKPFCAGKVPEGKKTKANTYTLLENNSFAQNLWGYNLIPKQRKISAEQYGSEVGFVGNEYIDGDLGDCAEG